MPEFVVIFAIGLLIVLASRLNERYLHHYYFSISQIMTGIPSNVKRLGVPLRLVVPVVAGTLAGFLPLSNTILLAALSTGFGAFLLVWPLLLRPEYLPEKLADRRYELRMLYVTFVTLYSVLGALGGALARVVLAILRLLWAILSQVIPGLTVEAIVEGVINELIAFILILILTGVGKFVFDKLRNQLQME